VYTCVFAFLDFKVVPLDSVEHEPAEFLLLLGAAFNDNNVQVFEEENDAGHVQLVAVGLELELGRRVGQVLDAVH